MPGGCANVAANVSTMSGKAHLFGYVGDDSALKKLNFELDKYKIYSYLQPSLSKTTQKIRVVAHGQQLLRIDDEDGDVITDSNDKFIKILEGDKFDAIIVSDYAKGTINKELMERLKDYAKWNNIPIIVDPRPSNKHLYNDVYLITPNKSEAEQMSGIKIQTEEDIEDCGRKLREELNCHVVIT
jgi:D-beta-D-heptose 7-phosphate kinase/D-beta-D-heptose 1-phosphate adenosyltransferase